MLKELTNKIKKIVPEIEELKFGCKINVKDARGLKRERTVIDYVLPVKEVYFDAGLTMGNKKLDEVDIIGNDITLEDVLRCMDNKLNKAGIITKKPYQESFGDIIAIWSWGKPLHKQSEETIKELNKLI